jgi:H+/Cl- antiporter ClcA
MSLRQFQKSKQWVSFSLAVVPLSQLSQILGGYVFDSFLSAWTLLIKALGLALAVASGLSLGKEVPFYFPFLACDIHCI